MLFSVSGGGHFYDGMKQFGEVGQIAKATVHGNGGDGQFRLCQQLFCQIKTLHTDVIADGNAGFVLKSFAHMEFADMHICGNGVNRQRLLQIVVDIGHKLAAKAAGIG